MTRMTKGANIAVSAGLVRATLLWTGGDTVPDVDGSALLLQADGRVSSDADLVFYNQPEHLSGTVKHAGRSTEGQAYDVIDINLVELPTTVERIALAASSGTGTFGEVPDLRLVLSDLGTGESLAEFAMSADSETAFVCGELYRRDAGWKFRAIGQGFATGLAGLATEYGIDVGGDADPAEEGGAVPAPDPGPQLPPPSFPAPSPAPSPSAPWPAPDPAAPEPAAPEPAAPEPAAPEPAAPESAAPEPAAPEAVAPLPPSPPAAPVFEAPAQWAAPPPARPAPPVPPVVRAPAPPPAPAPQAPEFPAARPVAADPVATLDGGPVTLRRNERVTLTSAAAGPLMRVMLDLSWEPAPGRLSVDLDASVIAFDSAGKKLEIVWYQHQNEFSGALQHTGDAKGDGSQTATERLLVDLPRLPAQVDALVFTITSFHGHTFTDLAHAWCVLSDDTGRPIVTYDLTDTQPSTAVLMAIVRRTGPGVWQMRAIGEYHDCRTVKKLVDPAARQVGIH